ncbi:hypothetical protein OIU78_015239 [Salix suchowensis]|nr:hypothetical protein OIU78_015239 [Salix suchowensis]
MAVDILEVELVEVGGASQDDVMGEVGHSALAMSDCWFVKIWIWVSGFGIEEVLLKERDDGSFAQSGGTGFGLGLIKVVEMGVGGELLRVNGLRWRCGGERLSELEE